jgi:pyruvate/2-oxoglutarate dehydrogenase complex dihydrolipoamide dehydrogenase (E3) component
VIHKEARENDLLTGEYDAVILATGAVPVIPSIEGLTEYYWAEFLLDENLPENKKILIIGGGLVGVEIASKLIDKNNYVTIVEMLDEIANGMEMIEKTLTLKKLKSQNVPIHTGCRVTKINDGYVYLSGKEELVLEGVDKIIVATGMKSYAPLYHQLKNKLPVFLIGDAREVGKAQDAIRSAYITAREL